MGPKFVYIPADKIEKGPCPLPKSFDNISGFHHLGESPEGRERLAEEFRWYLWDDSRPEIDPATERISWDGEAHSIIDDVAYPNWVIEPRDLEAEKAARIEALLEERAEAVGLGERQQALLAWDGDPETVPEELL